MSIEERLKKIRKYRGLTPKKLGPMIDVPWRTLYYYEKDASSIPLQKLIKIAEICNIDFM